jgi:hypothetical protein
MELTDSSQATYRLSIVVATRTGWPRIRPCVDAIVGQLDAAHAELIVADSSGLPVPDFAISAPNIRWLQMPGYQPHELRHHGYGVAQAPIVATTEDHCEPSSDWALKMLAIHDLEEDAVGVFGLVDNGSRDKIEDWALYSVGYLPWAPPHVVPRGLPGHANLSFKAYVFGELPPTGDRVLEFRYVEALRDAGYEVVSTDSTLVTHFQSAGLPATMHLLFHNGRLIAGLRRTDMSLHDWVRALAPAAVAVFRTARTLSLARTKPEIRLNVLRGAPYIALFHLTHTLGEGVGYLGGPGRSGYHVH